MKSHREKFTDLISEIANGGTRYTVFNDFCKLSALAVSNRFDFNRRREDTYLEIINKYSEENIKKLVEMYCELTLELEDCIGEKILRVNSPPLEEAGLFMEYPLKYKPHYEDVLGDIFKEFKLYDRDDGQVFTPSHIGELMGDLTLTKDYVESEIKRQGFVVIKENCCGSGAITLNALNVLLKMGVSPNYQAVVVASDMDERCIHMIYLQLSLYGIPAVVLQQNNISDEVYDTWYTPLFVKDNWLNKFDWRCNSV